MLLWNRDYFELEPLEKQQNGVGEAFTELPYLPKILQEKLSCHRFLPEKFH